MERVWTVKRLAISRSARARQNKLFKEAVRNLGNFVVLPKIFFEARKIEILSSVKMAVIIPGRKGNIEGFSFVSQNVSSPKLLGIVTQRGVLKWDPRKPNNLFIRGDGMISVSGEKTFGPPERTGQPKGALKRLPAKGPDLTSVDGMEFCKTGTIQIAIKLGALVILS